jgi:beta-lactamase regulating signal transducer with metallopeptidase domain
MRNFLITMLQCTVSMSLVTLAYAALTPLLSKRYATKWRYMAWLVIAAGWVFPFRPQINLSFLLPQSASIFGTPIWPIADMIPFIADASVDTGSMANVPATAIPLWSILAAVWVWGVVSFAAYHVLRHIRFMRMARRWSEPVTDPESLRLLDGLKSEMGIKAQVVLNVCQSAISPMLIGFFRPAVLLPPIKIAGDELRFVLKHELIHFQRRDLWGKALILAATALHWFNPAVRIMAKAAAAQCEISCDELTLQNVDFHRRKQYAETIIGIVRNMARPQTALSTNFYGGKRGMKNRIFSIMDTKRKKAGIAVFCVVLASAIAIGAAVAAAANGETAVVTVGNIGMAEDIVFSNN